MTGLRTVALAIAVAALPAIAGCTADSAADAAEPAGSTVAPVAPVDGVGCTMHMPGELLTAAEAMVMFDPERVCLGYVTVRPGTPVMFHNTDTVEHRVTITDADDAELTSFAIVSGSAASRALQDAGVYHFRLSAIPSFVGTIEVVAPGG